jgi:hypothetical protein
MRFIPFIALGAVAAAAPTKDIADPSRFQHPNVLAIPLAPRAEPAGSIRPSKISRPVIPPSLSATGPSNGFVTPYLHPDAASPTTKLPPFILDIVNRTIIDLKKDISVFNRRLESTSDLIGMLSIMYTARYMYADFQSTRDCNWRTRFRSQIKQACDHYNQEQPSQWREDSGCGSKRY